MYETFEKWLNATLEQSIPAEVKAFCFNIYDDGDNTWSVELVGCSSFDENDADWACDEVFDNRDEPFAWEEAADYDHIFAGVKVMILQYLQDGAQADVLKNSQGVAMGFVDGDLELLLK